MDIAASEESSVTNVRRPATRSLPSGKQAVGAMGKRGPRKKSGGRYPSGDLKPAISPAAWGRIQQFPRMFGALLASELGRKRLHRELTSDQAGAGFYIGCIYRLSHPSALKEMRDVHPDWLAEVEELQAKLAITMDEAQ